MIQIDPRVLSLVPDVGALSRSVLTRFLNRARQLIEISGNVELLLTSDAELKRLNRTFRNKNKSTDILSFPAPPEIYAQHAGDLAISLETAARQAEQFGHTLSDEVRILILHGLLHLSGLDHETDRGQMAARETALRTTLKLPTNLIARVAMPSQALKNRAQGPSHTSLGQRPRSTATKERKRAEGPRHKSPKKAGGKP